MWRTREKNQSINSNLHRDARKISHKRRSVWYVLRERYGNDKRACWKHCCSTESNSEWMAFVILFDYGLLLGNMSQAMVTLLHSESRCRRTCRYSQLLPPQRVREVKISSIYIYASLSFDHQNWSFPLTWTTYIRGIPTRITNHILDFSIHSGVEILWIGSNCSISDSSCSLRQFSSDILPHEPGFSHTAPLGAPLLSNLPLRSAAAATAHPGGKQIHLYLVDSSTFDHQNWNSLLPKWYAFEISWHEPSLHPYPWLQDSMRGQNVLNWLKLFHVWQVMQLVSVFIRSRPSWARVQSHRSTRSAAEVNCCCHSASRR